MSGPAESSAPMLGSESVSALEEKGVRKEESMMEKRIFRSMIFSRYKKSVTLTATLVLQNGGE